MNVLSWRFAATVALLAAAWAANLLSENRRPEDLALPLETIPQTIGDWTGQDLPGIDEDSERVLKATSYLRRTYRDGKEDLSLFVAYYAMQRAGETMHSPKNCLPGSGWEIWNYDAEQILVEGSPTEINKYYIQKGRQRLVVYYWYQNAERVVASEYYAKVCLVWDAIRKGRTAGAIVRLTLPDEPWAREAGPEFAARIIPLISTCMPTGAG